MRRAVVVTCIGLLVALVLVWLVSWELAVIAGWDAAAFTFLLSVWPIIIGADSSHAAQLASREDESRGSATLLGAAGAYCDLPPPLLAAVLKVDRDEWLAEIPQVTEWFTKFGDKLPAVLWAELDALRARLADA